jgi:hypothetical protein
MTIAKLIIGSALALMLASGCLASETVPDEWPCKSQADCLAGENCFDTQDGHGNRCRPGSFCTQENDCAANEYCDYAARTCKHAECENDSPCGWYACNKTAHVCFTTCTSSFECSGGYVCIGGACVAPQCLETDPNPCLGYRCSSGVCRTSCASNNDCTLGYGCVAPNCVYTGESQPCTSSSECTTTPYLFCDSGECGLACSHRTCATGCEDCGGVPQVCGATGFCEACVGLCP